MQHYDYIISGSGAAGLSLLMRFMQEGYFAKKKILVVDRSAKDNNDHTWCYWEKDTGIFEPVVFNRWGIVDFYSTLFSGSINIRPYTYKMIRSIDLYNYVIKQALKKDNIDFINGVVNATGNEGENGLVIVDGQKFTADYVFNSIIFKPAVVPTGKHYLLQHFKGIVINTPEPFFDVTKATLMDFRVDQRNGTTFYYVLPLAANRALVEYTLFSEHLLQPAQYDEALRCYITGTLKIKDYIIGEEEFGVIPMTNIAFEKQVGKVINIGTAGGYTKASSGYTFSFIQKHTRQLVDSILRTGEPQETSPLWYRRFKLYDSTLLNVLSNKKMSGEKIFATLFKDNPAPRVLSFLDNETSLRDEINIMATLPQGIFFRAAMAELYKCVW